MSELPLSSILEILKNPEIVKAVTDTAQSVTHDVMDASKSIIHDAADATKAVSHDLADVAKIESSNEKDIALKALDTKVALWQEQNRHEEFIISEQRKALEKFIDTNLQKLNSKIDFLRSQQQAFDDFYKQELTLLTEHITYLEGERAKTVGDKTQYIRLSDEITRLEDSKGEMKREYTKSSNRLTDAIKVLEVELQFSQPATQVEGMYLPHQQTALIGGF